MTRFGELVLCILAFGQILLFASLAILSKSLNLVEFFWLLCWSSFLAMTKKRIICKAMVTLAISNVFTLSMNNLLPLKSQIPMMYCDLYRWSEPSIKLILTEGLCVCNSNRKLKMCNRRQKDNIFKFVSPITPIEPSCDKIYTGLIKHWHLVILSIF